MLELDIDKRVSGLLTEHRPLTEARSAQKKGLYGDAVEKAVSSFQFVDGMMQYGRKYADAVFSSIESIDLVLRSYLTKRRLLRFT